jgi:hypothetical protein
MPEYSVVISSRTTDTPGRSAVGVSEQTVTVRGYARLKGAAW